MNFQIPILKWDTGFFGAKREKEIERERTRERESEREREKDREREHWLDYMQGI